MPFADYENFEGCVRDNQDKRDPEAYCAEIKRQIEGAELSDSQEKALARSECDAGHVHVDGACRPIDEVVESVDAPPSILSGPQHLTLKSLETEPIERVQEDDTTVRYKSLKLLSPGVWADAGSETATYYPPDGITALEPDYDEQEHDGPPVNIMHDLDMESFEAHEPSVAGHVDPDSLDTDDDGNLFGDVVFDTSKGAGQFADENLQSTLENEGTVGFGGPSVEIPARGLEQSHDTQRDMPRVDGGLLTGVAMVMDPASKSVNFAKEAARRPIAMSSSGESGKVLTRQADSMRETLRLLNDVDTEALFRTLQEMAEIQDLVERAEGEGFDSSENTVADLIDFVRGEMDTDDGDLEALQDAADAFLETVEADSLDAVSAEAMRDWASEQGAEMETHDGMEDDEEDDEDETEMEGGDDMDAVMERVQNLASRLEDLEDAMSQAMTADDVDAELSNAKGQELAAADTVEELEAQKEELDRRLSELEDAGKDAKTLTDQNDSVDYSDSDGGVNYDPATGSMSR